jgi:hypothetical protein
MGAYFMKTDIKMYGLALAALLPLALPFIVYAQEGEPPAQEETAQTGAAPTPAQEEAAATQEEAAPAREEATPAREESAPSQEETAPTREETAPAREEAATTREETATARKEPGYSFTGIVPEALIKPTRERGAFYPVDAVIGQLGTDDLTGGAGGYARSVMQDLLKQDAASASLGNLGPDITGDAMEKLAEAAPHKWRIGGGREEADGSVSFLFRFMGREKEVSGELYLRSGTDGWKTEDIIFNTPKELTIGVDTSSSGYTPYERFY